LGTLIASSVSSKGNDIAESYVMKVPASASGLTPDTPSE
jgi:hypothetical protein